MREELLIVILNMSFAGSIAALLVMAVRLVIRKLPGRYAYFLWAAVGIRLLCPSLPEADFSVLPVKPKPIGIEAVYERKPGIDTGVFFLDEPVNYMLEQNFPPQEENSVNPLQIWLYIGTCLWMAGGIFFVLINFFRYIKLKKKLKTAVVFKTGENFRKDKLRIYESDEISSPIAAGFFRPAIYIPFNMKEKEQEYVILHESVHIKRKDYLVKLIAFLALAVHWFNPVIWFSYFLLCEDMERACDEKVLDVSGEENRSDYSSVLLKFAMKQSRTFLPLAFGESHTKIRIKNILRYRRPAPWMGAILTFAAFLAGCALSTNPKEPEEGTSIAIIGGADGPTSVFLAGKISEDKEEISFQPVEMESLLNARMDRERKTIHLDYASKVQGQLIFHGPWGIFVYEKKDGQWSMSHSIDMKKVDETYMAEGKDTCVVPAGQGIFIGNKTSEGWEECYYYDFSSRKLFADKELAKLPDIIGNRGQIGLDKRLTIMENEEIREKGIPYDYGIYLMEEDHLGMLNSYTDRVLDLWFSDVDSQTQSMTQAYLFHGNGEETIFQEEVRQFLFYKDGYDYYVSLPSALLEFEGNEAGEGNYIPFRRELIRVDGQGHREVLDKLLVSHRSETSEVRQTSVIMAGDRLIYFGAEKAELSYFKSNSLVSINLDGSDRQTIGRDRIPYGHVRALSLDTGNNRLYFEGWTNEDMFPKPIYSMDTRLQEIQVMGEIDGNLITVRDGNFYFLHQDKEKQAIAVSRLSEGSGYYFYDKCGFNASEYACQKAYIQDDQIHMIVVNRDDMEQKREYQVPLEDGEKAKAYLKSVSSSKR
ncbi:M56 family metallopeptidase [Lachnospiraceae bacterium 62-35]